MITQPIGAKLPSCELPGGSFVNVEVVEGPDGLPDLLLRPSLPGELEGGGGLIVSASDLRAIYQWATPPAARRRSSARPSAHASGILRSPSAAPANRLPWFAARHAGASVFTYVVFVWHTSCILHILRQAMPTTGTHPQKTNN